jgi:hypothetical protein
MLRQTRTESQKRSVIHRSTVGRKLPLQHTYIEAVNEAGRALSKNYHRVQGINKKYGIRSSN